MLHTLERKNPQRLEASAVYIWRTGTRRHSESLRSFMLAERALSLCHYAKAIDITVKIKQTVSQWRFCSGLNNGDVLRSCRSSSSNFENTPVASKLLSDILGGPNNLCGDA